MSISDNEKQSYKERAQMIINNVRLMNGGDDIHTVVNIRTTAQIFIQMIERRDVSLTKEYADRIIDGLTRKCSDLFKRRFT